MLWCYTHKCQAHRVWYSTQCKCEFTVKFCTPDLIYKCSRKKLRSITMDSDKLYASQKKILDCHHTGVSTCIIRLYKSGLYQVIWCNSVIIFAEYKLHWSSLHPIYKWLVMYHAYLSTKYSLQYIIHLSATGKRIYSIKFLTYSYLSPFVTFIKENSPPPVDILLILGLGSSHAPLWCT